jgi:predicted naringenin-chalcone synthase
MCSLHIQPPTDDLEQVVAHALFSDAACALVVQSPGPEPSPGLSVIYVASVTDTRAAEMMTWTITDKGFRMTLSRRVPDILADRVEPLVRELLSANRLTMGDVSGWAVHPGGPRILDVVADRLGLGAEDLSASRRVLADHGNCSSATVLLVIDEIRRRCPPPGSHVVALAFGPGLTLYSALLRVE